MIRRRGFITGLGGAALPAVARAQQGERLRRVGVLVAQSAENDRAMQANIAAFRDGMAKLGWVEQRNLRIELRFGGGDAERVSAYAAELANLAPDAIVTQSAAATAAVQQQTQTIPIVITGVGGDPIGSGLVKSIARPEGNI